MKLLVRWVIAGLALFATVYLVPGIHVEDQNAWITYAVMAAILGLINAVIRPILKFLSCPLILLTLGLFVLVINAASFMLASSIAVKWFKVGFYVDNFLSAVLGSLILSFVTILSNLVLKDDNKRIEKIE